MKELTKKSLVILFLSITILMACEDDLEWEETGLPPPKPMQISTRAVAVGSRFVLLEDGSLWAWGARSNLREVPDEYRFLPTPLKVMDGVVQVSGSSGSWPHIMLTTTDNTLWAWGGNNHGRIGISRGIDLNVSHVVTEPIAVMDNVVSVNATSGHTMAITSDDTLWGWGANRYGVLGEDEIGNSFMYTPARIMDNVLAVASASEHAVAIRYDNTLWAWGRNNDGQLGDGTTRNRRQPVQIMEDVVTVSASFSRTAAITSDGALWTWGSNFNGQLGDGTTRNHRQPVHIMDDVVAVSMGSHHTLAITSDGGLWAWGGSYLGDGNREGSNNPVRIMENVVYAYAGDFHSLIITSDGSVWAWGTNSYGELGIGTTRGAWEMGPTRRDDIFSAWLSPIQVMAYESAEENHETAWDRNLIGRWQSEHVAPGNNIVKILLTFNHDGTGSDHLEIEYVDTRISGPPDMLRFFRWSTEGNNIRLVFVDNWLGEDNIEKWTYNIDDDTLTIFGLTSYAWLSKQIQEETFERMAQ